MRPGDMLYYKEDDTILGVIEVLRGGVMCYDIINPVYDVDDKLYLVYCTFDELERSTEYIGHVLEVSGRVVS